MDENIPEDVRLPEALSLTDLVRRADETGALAGTLSDLPRAVADALQAIATGERLFEPLAAEDILRLGQAVAAWGVPFGRCSLSPWGPRFAASGLIERLGLSPQTAERIASVIAWPIGFMREDFADWAVLSPEEAEQVMDYLAKTHGLYTTGTKYAAP